MMLTDCAPDGVNDGCFCQRCKPFEGPEFRAFRLLRCQMQALASVRHEHWLQIDAPEVVTSPLHNTLCTPHQSSVVSTLCLSPPPQGLAYFGPGRGLCISQFAPLVPTLPFIHNHWYQRYPNTAAAQPWFWPGYRPCSTACSTHSTSCTARVSRSHNNNHCRLPRQGFNEGNKCPPLLDSTVQHPTQLYCST